MNGYTFCLPWPARQLSPNARIDRRAKAQYVANAHNEAFLSVLSVLSNTGTRKLAGDLEMALLFFPPDKRRRDLDNLLASLKPAIDGVFAAIETDDSRVKRTVLEWGEREAGGRVQIVIREKVTTPVFDVS